MSQTPAPIRVSQVASVFVPVRDQDRAIDFYVGTLGWEKHADDPFGDGERWVEVAPRGAVTTLALVPPRPGTEFAPSRMVCSLMTAEVDADHAALRAAGVDVDEEVMRMGDGPPPMFFFRDQDGNTLLIVERT
jgi:catechol 2,3-dioxygenase-like lactoylglutathione lyase family enzyme